jgi:hypothetical protein
MDMRHLLTRERAAAYVRKLSLKWLERERKLRMVSKGKKYRVYGWHPGNLPRCLNIFDTYELADQFAKTMTKLRWLDVGIFNPAMQPIAAPDNHPSLGE